MAADEGRVASSKAGAAKEAAPITTILGAIGSGRWTRALLTTYTLSLTYVESHVLPALRRANCETLTILADAAGYRDTLMEQRSRSVGRDYAVLPVKAGSGIFHPKLVYLESAEGPLHDLLLVGSGNLTFPGHGGNVEVLEVLRPATAAGAFLECAKFFTELLASDKHIVSGGENLQSIPLRLEVAAKAGENTEDVRFIHSLSEAAQSQLERAAKAENTTWQELLVLSPYHHPKAEPVMALAAALKVHRLTIGVSAKKGEPTAFPFEAARGHFRNIKVVVPNPEKGPGRALHAKWIELRGSDCSLALTGSFNATLTSFSSTLNVECGIIRRLDGPSKCWAETEEPKYRKGEFPLRLDASRPCIFAVLPRPNELKGSIVGKAPSGIWSLRLETEQDVLHTDTVRVDAEGKFELVLPQAIDTAEAGTVQVTLVLGEIIAKGWVQHSQFLSLPARSRNLFSAALRARNGSATRDDLQEILDAVGQAAAQLDPNLLIKAAAHRFTGRKSTPSCTDRLWGDIDAIPEPSEQGSPERSFLSVLNRGADDTDFLDALLATMLPRLGWAGGEGHGDHPRSRWNDERPESDADENSDSNKANKDNKKDKSQAKKAEFVYKRFAEQMVALNAAARVSPNAAPSCEAGKVYLLMLILGTIFIHQVLPAEDVNEAAARLTSTWMRDACSVRLPLEEKIPLQGAVCGLAAVHARLLLTGPGEERKRTHGAEVSDVAQATDEFRELARKLEAFHGRSYNPEFVLQEAAVWLSDARTHALVDGSTEEALECLRLILSQLTERQVLRQLLNGDATAPPSLTADFSPTVAALFGELTQTFKKDTKRVSAVDVSQLNTCPNLSCHVPYIKRYRTGPPELESDINWRLKKFGAYKCRCGQFLTMLEVT
jgi:hypothetical protein